MSVEKRKARSFLMKMVVKKQDPCLKTSPFPEIWRSLIGTV